MSQKSYRAIATFVGAAGSWLENHTTESKFRYAVKKVLKQASARWDEHNEKQQDLAIEHCLTDKDGSVRYVDNDPRKGHEYSKEGLRKLIASRKALSESLVDVTPFMAKDVPQDLVEAQREAFAGFVLPELDDEPAETEESTA